MPPPELDGSARLRMAIAAIDAANRDDPHTIVVGDRTVPKELTHAEMATAWVRRLDPAATDAQILAARAHHLRRWTVPRRDYPEGRAGYLRWRADRKARHAADVAEILRSCGYGDDVVERVGQIVRKEGIASDPAVQTHEDALCLVFLETQFDDLIAAQGPEKATEIVRKTLRKMSAAAITAARGLPYSPSGRQVLGDAVAR